MLSGISLCTLVGTSRQSIVAAYVLLSLVDISAIYNEIRAVVFTVLNHERTHLLAGDYVAAGSDPKVMVETSSATGSIASSEEAAAAVTPVAAVLSSAAVDAGAAKPPPTQETSVREDEIGEADSGRRLVSERRRWQKPEPIPSTGEMAAVGQGQVGSIEETATAETNVYAEALVGAVKAGGGRGGGPAERAGAQLLSSPATVSRRENIFTASRLSTNVFKTWSQVRERSTREERGEREQRAKKRRVSLLNTLCFDVYLSF